MATIDIDPQGGANLLEYVGGTAGVDTARAKAKYEEAHALVSQYVREVTIATTDAPAFAIVAREAVLEVGSKLWLRRNAPNGEAMYGDLEGAAPMLAPIDPLVTVYPTLSRFLPGGFA